MQRSAWSACRRTDAEQAHHNRPRSPALAGPRGCRTGRLGAARSASTQVSLVVTFALILRRANKSPVRASTRSIITQYLGVSMMGMLFSIGHQAIEAFRQGNHYTDLGSLPLGRDLPTSL
jgi:hypothetical protein